jgi:hypothetical protein
VRTQQENHAAVNPPEDTWVQKDKIKILLLEGIVGIVPHRQSARTRFTSSALMRAARFSNLRPLPIAVQAYVARCPGQHL